MKINTVIFDMDGVLVDARDWHYESLNSALEIFGAAIPYSEHLERFDGLPTKAKLSMLVEEGRIPKKLTHTI
jgi:phosphoglycolate phosphatase-like HAD superfamily hydrolase